MASRMLSVPPELTVPTTGASGAAWPPPSMAGVTVVDGPGRVAVPPGVFLGRRQPLDQAGHLGPGQAVGRQCGKRWNLAAVGLELALQLGHRVGGRGHWAAPSGVPASGVPASGVAASGVAAGPRAGSLVASASPARQT